VGKIYWMGGLGPSVFWERGFPRIEEINCQKGGEEGVGLGRGREIILRCWEGGRRVTVECHGHEVHSAG
jgi:hypothetical protein